ncbi:MAG: glutamine--fructose-6-phosphate transaminase (isomerizing) [candidate division WOR-3 bacterium]|jgi:glucosamine--fructose-6-phosphate aminotransferase (isomerizing)|nr:glutamine--fructose-6-phosphate transaminase (isomerizing) [candidate division WOR-3 bacterium]MCR4424160.1 glutamine--fructose-6-phosphate transaminase (isomerizing) [candidate division WOR-3 bacterium]MDH7519421.1 glutamine--fructose-6-phosphate transaminase (isomerizing) [bacterium]
MCGIVGYIGPRNVVNVVMIGLERLEYRGYDSCGIAVVDGGIKIRKTAGRLQRLKEILEKSPVAGRLGIGHTRWATHGAVTDENAHPFVDCQGKIALVHNGIIENYRELRKELMDAGHRFSSSTDTEVLVHLIESFYRRNMLSALRKTVARLKGAYGLVVVSADEPDRLYAVKMGSPLLIGKGKDEFIVASDAPALVGIARRMVVMQDGEIAVVKQSGVKLFDFEGKEVVRQFVPIELKAKEISKGRYPHYMRKEIFEQPEVLEANIKRRFREDGVVLDPEFLLYPDYIERIGRIVIQACGTSYHAGLVGRYYFEKLSRIPVSVEISSELRTADFIFENESLMVAISQSGETADTIAALRDAQRRGVKTLGVLNVPRSSIAREADSVVHIHAGPEIGVASTKAYTAQILTLLVLALYFGRVRKVITDEQLCQVREEVGQLPEKLKKILELDRRIREIATRLAFAHDFIFLGRGINYPSALEGALKLKEISYVHATGYPAGEMKHGPISLINEQVPVIGIALRDSVYDKMISNLAEAKARRGRIIAIGTEGDEALEEIAEAVLYLPPVPEYLSPIAVAPPLQLLAYHIAVLRGCDVDKPRNLAKSVTVE